VEDEPVTDRRRGNQRTSDDGLSFGIDKRGLLHLTTEAYAGVVSFDGTMVALHRLTAGAVAEDRDE